MTPSYKLTWHICVLQSNADAAVRLGERAHAHNQPDKKNPVLTRSSEELAEQTSVGVWTL